MVCGTVKCMTRRYDIETGKSNAEILTPRGQDLASTFKKLCLPLSRCPISSRGRVLVEIPNRRSNKSEDGNSREFTQEMRGEFGRKLCRETSSILN